MRAREDMVFKQAGFHEHMDGYKQARREKENVIDSLKQVEGGEKLEEFLNACIAVKDARQSFAEAVAEGEYQPGSGEYTVLESNLNITLKDIENTNPQIYGSVLTYLDKVRQPYENELRTMSQEKQSAALAYSLAGRVGRFIEPVLQPMGFDWRIGTALIGAFAAKEVFVAQMGIVFSVGDDGEGADALRKKLRKRYTPLIAFCVMLFNLN